MSVNLQKAMNMPTRKRSYIGTTPRGVTSFAGSLDPPQTPVNTSWYVCEDDTSPGDCWPFTVSKYDFVGGRINRPLYTWYATVFQNYLCDAAWAEANWPLVHVPNAPSNVQVATKAAARSNPSRPYVDLPVALLELRELPLLLRDSGRSFFGKKMAETNLKYEFGIKPLVGDIVKLLSFQDEVSRRIKEIERLRSEKGLRRTVRRIWEDELKGTRSPWTVHTSKGISISVGDSWASKAEMWGHCRWRPSIDMPRDLSAPKMSALARRAVLGLTVDSSTAWELIPWSWLVDWCSNFGDFLSAQRNLIPAELYHVSVMKQTTTSYVSNAWTGSNNASMTPIGVTRVLKQRMPSYVLPEAHFPFLDGRQVGILASLAAVRR